MRLAPLFLLLAIACGTPAPPGHERVADPRESGDQVPRAQGADLRALGANATYATVLESARQLDRRRDTESSAGCLLRPGREWRLEADLAVAVRPLPVTAHDLDEVLASDPGPVNVLSRWGAYGPGDHQRPSFTAVTTTLPPRREPAIVWVITDHGAYVRSSAEPLLESVRPIPIEQLASTLPSDVGALFIAAEGNTSLPRLAEALALVPEELAGRVALAAALAPGTTLPARPPADDADASAGLCADGLPELPESAPAGDLRADVIVQNLGPLRDAAATCVSGTQGSGAAGGRVALALRIGPDGRVTEACATRDETNDPVLRECLARAARAVAFPAPNPPGYVDVELPLALAPLASQRQMPLCP